MIEGRVQGPRQGSGMPNVWSAASLRNVRVTANNYEDLQKHPPAHKFSIYSAQSDSSGIITRNIQNPPEVERKAVILGKFNVISEIQLNTKY